MTTYLVRSDIDEQVDAPDDVHVLDWVPGARAATIQIGEHGTEFFAGWNPTRAGADLLLFAAAAYCADRTTPRRLTPDGWTRQMRLQVPVTVQDAWREADWSRALRFLTGDDWHLEARMSGHDALTVIKHDTSESPAQLDVDAVCLFSGGLDSLCGVVDLMESDPTRRLCLLSHHEGGQASTAQQALFRELTSQYGSDRLQTRRLYLRPAPANQWQARPLPTSRENTTRSRSLLFLGAALAVASAQGPDTAVYLPENGFIGINVPLTRARVGSLSTRTTHPHFMSLLAEATHAIGVTNPVINPYRLRTKGEMLAESRNPDLLRRLAPDSLSCAHPEAARYVKRPQGNCGYCFPCLIRRASLAHVGWTDTGYAWDVLTDGRLLRRRTRRGADLRALINGAFVDRPDRDVLRNGPLPEGERAAFLDVWRRGLAEIRAWLTTDAQGDLASLLRPAS